MAPKISTAQSLKAALKSWRVGAVTLLSLSSGLPLGIVLYVVPSWMEKAGVDIKTIGVLTLAQAPYAFKFLWSPLMDRWGVPRLGRKRGWILLGQLALAGSCLALASQAGAPSVGLVGALTLLLAFASASQDIAIDAYTVDSLLPEEQGIAVGARTAMYRIGMWIAGGAISFAALAVGGRTIGWGATLACLGGVFLLLAPVAVFAPEPAVQAPPPRTMREAVWEPFLDFFRKPRAMEIVAFLLLYKFADNLAVSLVRPFLLKVGYGEVDVGIASTTVGLVFTMVGTFVGGWLTNSLGVGRALWVFGILQSSAGLGYALVSTVGVNRPLMYAAMALEAGASGMGTGAFSVLLIRLTQKRFSATQYALFSSVFALGRTAAGPIAGALADAIGWRDFFLFTVVCGAPGLAMLHRFVPFGTRELPDDLSDPAATLGAPLTRSGLLGRGAAAALVGAALGAASTATLSGLKALKEGRGFSLWPAFERMAAPGRVSDWVELGGVIVFGLVVGFATAAYLAARRGLKRRPGEAAPAAPER